MTLSFTFVVSSFVFFSITSSAPAGHQDSCVDVKASSLELNKIARNVSLEVSCFFLLQTISSFLLLKHYLLRRISEFENCSEFASQVMPVINKLHKDVTKCADSKGDWGAEKVSLWEKPYLCHYTLDRLFSFSIFTARVLSVGDPVHHTNGTTQKCM
uniref:Uncharacterized protein n=1 Tax=Oreochromis aureus TaxID=47969 RepID=A0A668T9N9_OREAU